MRGSVYGAMIEQRRRGVAVRYGYGLGMLRVRSISAASQVVVALLGRLRGSGGVAGQGTVEFAIVMAGFLVIVVTLGLLWRAFEGGLFIEHALAAASHHVQGVSLGTITDVFLY